jgi:hypothetical protein
MAFRCPQCFSPGSLQIIQSIELPNDRQWDEISLQAIRCSVCDFCGLAVYSELVSGAETDSWQHVGYWVSHDAFQSVMTAIQTCPNPQDRLCKYTAHTNLGRRDVHGLWRGLLELECGHTFSMRLASN